MIDKITFFNNIKIKTLNKLRTIKKTINYNLPKLKKLTHDIFESKEGMPEVLLYNPSMVEGEMIPFIKDKRFANFGLEYRAYNFEGPDIKFPSNYVCIDSNGDRRIKPHIYLKYVEIKPEFARHGIYKKTIQEIYGISKFEGCDGRIILDARKIEGHDMTQIPSPSLAHWKCGFRFANENNNKIMQQVLEGKLPPESAPEGYMYYSLA